MELAHLLIEAQSGPLSNECVDRGIISFLSFIEWVEQLPYRRNSNRADYSLVFDEECGACSTKNALVKAVAVENGWKNIQLFLGVYKMSEETNAGVGKILNRQGLTYLPECHTYLKINGIVRDVTGLPLGAVSFLDVLENEVEIQPEQIADYKVEWHQTYMKKWAAEQNIEFDNVWAVRQQCIVELSSNS